MNRDIQRRLDEFRLTRATDNENELIDELVNGQIDRETFLRQGAMIGLSVGALAGFFGGWVDILFSRLIEVVMCIPSLVLILALVAMLDKVTNWHLMLIVGITSWTGIARLARAEFLKLKQMEFVSAARAMGGIAVRRVRSASASAATVRARSSPVGSVAGSVPRTTMASPESRSAERTPGDARSSTASSPRAASSA